MKNFIKYFLILSSLLCYKTAFAQYAKSIPEIKYLFLIDQDSGEVLLEKNADERTAPSSMTKLMTAYVVFEQLKLGNINLKNQAVIGKDAWKKTGSRMLLGFGDVVNVSDLIIGLVIASGNDAATALAEITSGSVKDFADLMNDTARRIGLKNSHFKNPHGLNEEDHYMSLRDLATLTTRLMNDFPEYMHYFSKPYLTYHGVTQPNHNPLIRDHYPGATGMKTGYTAKGGYGMVGTATRDGRRLIAITNGSKSARHREIIITALLDYGFDNFKKINLFHQGQVVAKADTWLGRENFVDLVINQDVSFTVPKSTKPEDIKITVTYKSPLYTPINAGDELASLKIKIADKEMATIPLFANEDVEKLSYSDRIVKVTKYKIRQFLKRVGIIPSPKINIVF